MTMMKVGVLNTDHPELTSSRKEADRFGRVKAFLQSQDCDLLLILEANGGMHLDGYASRFSAESPFINQGRSRSVPNVYHQVGIYSRLEGLSHPVNEPINGLLFEVEFEGAPLCIYANVMTIKDQWSKSKTPTYKERVAEQLNAMEALAGRSFLVGGDFNCRAGLTWHASQFATISERVDANGWQWPTRDQISSVQHIVHSRDLMVSELEVDESVKYQRFGDQPDKSTGLSDHPFVKFAVNRVS